jgi:hypothetical protein
MGKVGLKLMFPRRIWGGSSFFSLPEGSDQFEPVLEEWHAVETIVDAASSGTDPASQGSRGGGNHRILSQQGHLKRLSWRERRRSNGKRWRRILSWTVPGRSGKGASHHPFRFLTTANLFNRHGLFDLNVRGRRPEVDDHHLVEDHGICLGEAQKQALGDKSGLERFGEATIPWCESLCGLLLTCQAVPSCFSGPISATA